MLTLNRTEGSPTPWVYQAFVERLRPAGPHHRHRCPKTSVDLCEDHQPAADEPLAEMPRRRSVAKSLAVLIEAFLSIRFHGEGALA